MKPFLIFFLTISIFLTGCSNEGDKQTQKDDNKLVIYTTVYPLQYFVERIGGDFVETKSIYPTGADEHTFEPTQRDMINLAEADLFIFIGLGLEGFVDKAQKTLKNEEVTMVAAGENIHFESREEDENSHEKGEQDGHHHGDIDPHVWLDPIYAKDLAEAIKNALCKKMPEQKKQFEENYTLLTNELEQLNTEFDQTISKAKHKEIIVSHAAFGYWEKRYGLKQISVSGLSTSNEPTQKELEKIILEAKKHELYYVFFEQNVSSKLTEIIQKELNAQPLILHNLSVLTDDDLKNNPSYFSIMRNNLQALEKGLNE